MQALAAQADADAAGAAARAADRTLRRDFASSPALPALTTLAGGITGTATPAVAARSAARTSAIARECSSLSEADKPPEVDGTAWARFCEWYESRQRAEAAAVAAAAAAAEARSLADHITTEHATCVP